MYWESVCGGVRSHWELENIDRALEKEIEETEITLGSREYRSCLEVRVRTSETASTEIRSGALRYHVVT